MHTHLHSTMVSINRHFFCLLCWIFFYLHSTMVSINQVSLRIKKPLSMNLHSTKVSINRQQNIFRRPDSRIYIPLWYLLIASVALLQVYVIGIYIPLWYLLIPRGTGRAGSKSHLHSTMVSINHSNAADFPRNNVHLHSTMVSINHYQKERLTELRHNLHSTMVSINRQRIGSIFHHNLIYIPLWYLLITCLRNNVRSFVSFTFHYGIY